MIGSDGKLKKLIFWGFLMFFSLAIRLYFFHGWGLGDDPNYFSAIYTLRKIEYIPFQDSGYYYRFFFWAPPLILFKIFGVSEFAFIIPILIFDLTTIILVYILAKQFFDETTALLSAVFYSLNPFNVVFSTTFTIDFTQSMFICICAIYYNKYIKNEGIKLSIASGLAFMCAYLVNPKALFLIPAFAAHMIWNLKKDKSNSKKIFRHIIIISVFLWMSFALDYTISGNSFGYFRGENKMMAGFPLDFNTFIEYPKYMFTSSPFGTFMFGLSFYFIFAAIFAIVVKKYDMEKNSFFIFWFLSFMVFTCFFPQHILSPKFSLNNFYAFQNIRYLALLMPPASILTAYFLKKKYVVAPKVDVLLISILLLTNLFFIHVNGNISWDSSKDARLVRNYISNNPHERYYLDINFKMGTERLVYDFNSKYNITEIDAKTNISSIRDGIVFSGGSKNHIYGCMECVFNIEDRDVSDWILLDEIEGEKTTYRRENLRIWKVE